VQIVVKGGAFGELI